MFSIQSVFRKQPPPSLNIMIHNTDQFTQRLSKNTVCCFWPRHNVTSENRRSASPSLESTFEGVFKWLAQDACATRPSRIACTNRIMPVVTWLLPLRFSFVRLEGDVLYQSNMWCADQDKGTVPYNHTIIYTLCEHFERLLAGL